uniref:BTB domain-containing protein n=1 Tax=Panagrolaimus sp. JU765 TaxID=591449 RepID=A0AC34RTH6_9BILA
MMMNIIQLSSVTIPESDYNGEDGFTSDKEQIGTFNDYSFYFWADKDYSECGFVDIYLDIDSPLYVKVTWTCTVNSISMKDTAQFDSLGRVVFRGKKSNMFKNGFLKMDSILEFEFTPQMISRFKTPTSHTVAMLKEKKFTDFTFCVGNEEIKVHKSIIAVASSVFAAMLETDCKEIKESKVVIEDFDYETVDAAVSLMYTRKVDYLSVNTLLNLYKFADKYDLLDTVR